MKPPDSKLDASMQAFAKRWMKSLDKPRATTTLGYFFVGLFILFWSSSLTIYLGFELKKGVGTLVFIGLSILLTLTTLLAIRLMAVIGVDRPTRSALLFSAVIGPYVNMMVEHTWKMPTISHIAGFLASIFSFLLSLVLDRLFARPTRKTGED